MINQLHPDLEVCKCDLKGSWTRLSLFYFFKPAILLNILNCIMLVLGVVILAKYLQFVS